MNRTLPTDSNARKEIPLRRGCARYFPAALALVAITSKKGNDKHNPGEEMHHARGKSNDHADCVDRHMGDIDDLIAFHERIHLEGQSEEEWKNQLREELGQLAWRALALVQEHCEKYLDTPLAPAAREPDKKPAKRDLPRHGRASGITGFCECGDPSCDWDIARDGPIKPAISSVDLRPKKQI